MRVMFYVQHLLGIGHLVRASRIASAMADAGQHVTMVTGGMPVEGFPGHRIDTIQLSPVRSKDSSFSGLIDESGRKVDEAGLASRRDALLKAFKAIEPECLVIEAFPFARRQMRFELLPLLENVARLPAARRPLVASSIRDILQPKSPERDQATAQLVRQYFVLVLVHADRRLATLEETLVPIYLLHRYQLHAAGKLLGGEYFRYAMRGDGQRATDPVDGEKQRAALQTK